MDPEKEIVKTENNQEQPKQNIQSEEKKPMDADELQKQRALDQLQQKAIREQIEAQSPLIGEIFPLALLMDEFVHNQGFYIKVQDLMGKFQKYRKTRRDGSCFYRALNYCIFERIVLKNDKKLQEHIIKKIKSCKEHLLKAKYEGLVFEDLQELFLEKLDKKIPKTEGQVLSMFRNPEESNYLVMLLRFITSGEIINNSFLYETFIDNQIPVETFCHLEVEPIDKEADQITIMALINYLEVAIKIVYLDASKNKEAYTVILPESAEQSAVIATLLYRPGHYDILYS